MGARGNSGVITSQILRGIADGLAGRRRFNGLDLADALALGSKTAYGAVGEPVEGTILTVIREASAAAVAAAERDDTMESVLAATVEAARDVGCPDAIAPADPARGGRRRFRRPGAASACSRGRSSAFAGGSAAAGPRRAPGRWARQRAVVAPAFAGRRGGRGARSLRLRDGVRPGGGAGPDAGRARDPKPARGARRTRSSSRVTGDWSRSTSTTSGRTRSSPTASSLGALTRITVENLDTMADDVREARAAEFVTGDDAREPAAGPAERTRARPSRTRARRRATIRGASTPRWRRPRATT